MLIPRTAALLGALAFAPTLLAQTAPNPQTPAPFFVESIDFGTGLDGRGIGIFLEEPSFQSPFGSNFAPSASLIQEIPEVEFDSYVAFGGAPSNAEVGGIAPPVTPEGFGEFEGFFDNPFSLDGALGAGEEPGQSRINPNSGLQTFFFARLTLPAGTEPIGGIEIQIQGEEQPIFAFVEVVDDTGGDPGTIPGRGFPEFSFGTTARRTSKDVELSLSQLGIAGDTALFDVYDLYIELVPTPGAATAFLAVAGMGLTRRRR